jgi:hypothetical protein
MPGEFDGSGDAREVCRFDQPGGTHEFEDFALCCFERVRILGANLDEQNSGLGIGFVQAEPQLAEVLLELRRELLADPVLPDRVRRKYKIRNMHGLRFCALLDGETPLEIFSTPTRRLGGYTRVHR